MTALEAPGWRYEARMGCARLPVEFIWRSNGKQTIHRLAARPVR
ncbi:MAG: hypothetical protein U9R58_08530 [Chloroflexota bacterium]|nr:hypothetical protein [Chloroflexota bacterium]